ncbi:ubiquitin carboxyl-terminal hydrolase 16-like isoform X1 [Labeo rohita]|uniref:Ubiquitin carboxyl-terminal hydrolase n=1 Tax=Labeo rohita TaxID=84645 RepID=A0A498P2L2_LABRO|nr:ubiquitin carboxyl-terminal hydrolase 16-like isoform X1 [Labeo rohita]
MKTTVDADVLKQYLHPDSTAVQALASGNPSAVNQVAKGIKNMKIKDTVDRSSVSHTWKERRTIEPKQTNQDHCHYRGLRNQGATCYLNATLQVLFMTEAFRERVLLGTPCDTSEILVSALKELFEELSSQDGAPQSVSTKGVIKALGIQNVCEQQDAVEHFLEILEKAGPNLAEEHEYSLYAVINHSGSRHGGHYTADIRSFTENKWYCFNDSYVRETNERKLKCSMEAYLLLYQKIDSPPAYEMKKETQDSQAAPVDPQCAGAHYKPQLEGRSEGYTGPCLITVAGGKSTLYIVPGSLDTLPLPYSANEFENMNGNFREFPDNWVLPSTSTATDIVLKNAPDHTSVTIKAADNTTLMECRDRILLCGYKGEVSIQRKEDIVRSVVLHDKVRLLPMLQQICSGMNLFGLLALVQQEKDICRQLFVPASFTKASNKNHPLQNLH